MLIFYLFHCYAGALASNEGGQFGVDPIGHDFGQQRTHHTFLPLGRKLTKILDIGKSGFDLIAVRQLSLMPLEPFLGMLEQIDQVRVLGASDRKSTV
jgi:hypothetical protein